MNQLFSVKFITKKYIYVYAIGLESAIEKLKKNNFGISTIASIKKVKRVRRKTDSVYY